MLPEIFHLISLPFNKKINQVIDAKYDEAYERLKKSRKIRVKRSSDTETNDRNKKAFVQPTEVLKFSIQDAVIKSPFESEDKDTKESENKNKRETPVPDSTPMDSKIHVTSPMRNYRSTKHVSYDEVSTKLQKLIESALFDAIQKGKATDGDFLKFFYGDKIIKVPVSMAKYLNFNKSKETLTSHVTKKVVVPPPKEENTVEELKLLTPNKAYYPISNHGIKFEATPTFLPTIATTTEKAETYVNFESPIYVKPQPEIKEPIVMGKSVYFYKNDENYDKKNSMTSPGPVLFEDSIPTTPSPMIVAHLTMKTTFIIHQLLASPLNMQLLLYHVSDYKTGNNFGHKLWSRADR
ncbi:CLUMA_CG018664, isoform A [Clunio marinus]|uniref:CLUMA_CG018664, isoform A n=1 Tax=Clunio marinus TaxID=568069 RepID=A0A1J1IYQ9_9DIPT|nr:CLUMA_CG018664, isoform A [Clunio marinus]